MLERKKRSKLFFDNKLDANKSSLPCNGKNNSF